MIVMEDLIRTHPVALSHYQGIVFAARADIVGEVVILGDLVPLLRVVPKPPRVGDQHSVAIDQGVIDRDDSLVVKPSRGVFRKEEGEASQNLRYSLTYICIIICFYDRMVPPRDGSRPETLWRCRRLGSQEATLLDSLRCLPRGQRRRVPKRRPRLQPRRQRAGAISSCLVAQVRVYRRNPQRCPFDSVDVPAPSTRRCHRRPWRSPSRCPSPGRASYLPCSSPMLAWRHH